MPPKSHARSASPRAAILAASSRSRLRQFSGGGRLFALAGAASFAYLLVAAAGVVIAVRRHQPVWLLLTPIVYIPATISVVLTNMRYTITVQPLLLAFVAVALTAAWDLKSTRATSRPRSPHTPG